MVHEAQLELGAQVRRRRQQHVKRELLVPAAEMTVCRIRTGSLNNCE